MNCLSVFDHFILLAFKGLMKMVILRQKFERLRINASSNTEFLVENRKMKKLLIENYGENACFAYPRNRQKSQMFYSRLIPCETIVETIRSKNVNKERANNLREECLNFDFGLNTFCDAD